MQMSLIFKYNAIEVYACHLKEFLFIVAQLKFPVKVDYKTTNPCGSNILKAQLSNSDL